MSPHKSTRSYDRTIPRSRRPSRIARLTNGGGVRFGSEATMLRHGLKSVGFSPIPVMGKVPVQTEWQTKLNVSAEEIHGWEREFPDVKNTGLLTRTMPTLDVDILDPAAATVIEKLIRQRIGKHGFILKRVGLAPKFAIPFRADVPFKKIERKFLPADVTDDDDDKIEKLEFLADGQQVVAFGIHPDTGAGYTWSGGQPGKVKLADLPPINAVEARAIVDDASRLLIEQHGYRLWKKTDKKAKDDPTRSAWDNLAGERIDWSVPVKNIIDGVGLHDSIRDFAASMIGSGMSPNATKGILRAVMQSSLIPHDGRRWRERYDDIDRTVESAEEKYRQPATPHQKGILYDPWAPYIVPLFPLDVLPPIVAEFVIGQAEVIGCDPSSMAMSTLAALSGAIDHRFSLKMMRHGKWFASPRIWILLCGDPSKKKTPLFDTATAPLERYQNELQQEYKLALAAAAAIDDKSKKPEPPMRLVVWDATIEKLGELLARGERGLLVKRDEFSGWIGSMEKYSRSGGGASNANRAFWLKAWDGGGYVVDRINRGETFIANLSVSLVGGIQPEKLAELHGLTSDGLLQRFIPCMMGATTLPLDRPVNTDVYNDLVRQLISTEPRPLSLADAALAEMHGLRTHLHELEQSASGLANGFQAFVGKLAGMAGTLALILHMVTEPTLPVVQVAAAKKVHRLVVDFILPHAFEFYRTVESASNGDRLRKLASWILTNGQPRIVASDLTTHVWDFRGLTLLEIHERLSPLIAAGWLLPVDQTPANRAWSVNPIVFTQFAERRIREANRKTRLAQQLTPAAHAPGGS